MGKKKATSQRHHQKQQNKDNSQQQRKKIDVQKEDERIKEGSTISTSICLNMTQIYDCKF